MLILKIIKKQEVESPSMSSVGLVLIADLTQYRIPQERILSEGPRRSARPGGVLVINSSGKIHTECR